MVRTQSPSAWLGALACTLAVAALLSAAPAAYSTDTIANDWIAHYSASGSLSNVVSATGTNCQLCHQLTTGGDGFNGYGWNLRQQTQAGQTSLQAFLAVEPKNSDVDAVCSDDLREIDNSTQPGWTVGSNTIFFKSGLTTSATAPAVGTLDPPTFVTYCASSTTSIPGCSAAVSASGMPSLGNPAGFVITSGSVPGGNRIGVLYFSDQARAATPMGTQGGLLCVATPPPYVLTAPTKSGGTAGVCNGSLSSSLQAMLAANSSIVVVGKTLRAAFLFRDPGSPDTFGLSNAIEFSVCPLCAAIVLGDVKDSPGGGASRPLVLGACVRLP